MLNKIMDIFNLFRKGYELKNAEAWKDGGNAATIIAPLLVLAAKLAGDYGYGVQLSSEEATNVALGAVAVVQFVIHNITSKRAGLLPAKADQSGSTGDTNVEQSLPEPAKVNVQFASEAKDIDTSLYKS